MCFYSFHANNTIQLSAQGLATPEMDHADLLKEHTSTETEFGSHVRPTLRESENPLSFVNMMRHGVDLKLFV